MEHEGPHIVSDHIAQPDIRFFSQDLLITEISSPVRLKEVVVLRYPVGRSAKVIEQVGGITRNHQDLSYQEILGKESDIWLRYMIRYDMRPLMFHQPNVCAYDGVRS